MLLCPIIFWEIILIGVLTCLLIDVISFGLRRRSAASPSQFPFSCGLEIICVMLTMLLIPGSLILNTFCILCISQTWWFYIPYVTWTVFFSKSCVRGGRGCQAIRNGSFWKKYVNFFPIGLVKESEDLKLDGNTPYLFGYHPHGILSFGCFGNFASNATNFLSIFPGINVRIATLNVLVRLPFLREILLPMGFISADRSSVECVLKKGAGNGVMIVVGGAQEALKTAKGRHDLVLRKRKGFFKMGLQMGASLVPVCKLY